MLPALLRVVTSHGDEILALSSFTGAAQLYRLQDKNKMSLFYQNMTLGHYKAGNKGNVKMQLWKFMCGVSEECVWGE